MKGPEAAARQGGDEKGPLHARLQAPYRQRSSLAQFIRKTSSVLLIVFHIGKYIRTLEGHPRNLRGVPPLILSHQLHHIHIRRDPVHQPLALIHFLAILAGEAQMLLQPVQRIV